MTARRVLPPVTVHHGAANKGSQVLSRFFNGSSRPRHPTARATLAGVSMALALSSPCLAGGMADEATAPDPCITVDATVTGEMLANWRMVRAMTCPDQRRVFIDRATGAPLTDEEILNRIFDEPTPVPLPGSLALLLAGVGMLPWRRG